MLEKVCSTLQQSCADVSLNPRVYCLHPTTRPVLRTSFLSEKTNCLSFISFHGGCPPLRGRSSQKIWKGRKGFQPWQAILEDDDDSDYAMVPAPPPTDGRIDIVIDKSVIQQLDLSPAHAVLEGYAHQIGEKILRDPKELLRRTVGFVINYEWDDPYDMRELSEMPDVRLWFVRLDAMYPWLPVVLDWRAGELARYTAMLVPHQMKRKDGLVFNPEALELFVMSKLFTIYPWLQTINVAKADAKVNDMLRVLGYKIDAELFELLES